MGSRDLKVNQSQRIPTSELHEKKGPGGGSGGGDSFSIQPFKWAFTKGFQSLYGSP